MGKGRPFLEIFAAALNEDYRFPLLEVFAFLYAVGTIAILGLAGAFGSPSEGLAYGLITLMTGFPLFIFIILIFKNIAYGLGNDIEKGVVQTLLSYPLTRRSVLTAKLLSALGLSVLLFLSLQIFALEAFMPSVVYKYSGIVFLSYAAILSPAFLIAGIVLLLALFLRRGGLALVIGIVLYFAFSIISSFVTIFSVFGSDAALRAFGLIYPTLILGRHFLTPVSPFSPMASQWVPTLSEVLAYVGGAYLITAVVFLFAYVYFDRRFGI